MTRSASRPSARAYSARKPRTYTGAGSFVEDLALERLQVRHADLRLLRDLAQLDADRLADLAQQRAGELGASRVISGIGGRTRQASPDPRPSPAGAAAPRRSDDGGWLDRHRHAVGEQLEVVFLALRRVHQRRVREVEPAMDRLEAGRIVEAGDRDRLGAVDVADAAVRAPDVLEARGRRDLEQLVVRVDGSTSPVGRPAAGLPSGRARRARSTSRCASRGARSAAAGGGASRPTPPRRTRGGRGSAAGCRAGGARPRRRRGRAPCRSCCARS